jgi:hypothetical protein
MKAVLARNHLKHLKIMKSVTSLCVISIIRLCFQNVLARKSTAQAIPFIDGYIELASLHRESTSKILFTKKVNRVGRVLSALQTEQH